MAKVIRCKVTDEYVQGAGAVIGAAGSHNDVLIELTFSEVWNDTTKQVVWRNALGQNSTLIILTADMRTEEGGYLVSVPFEAKEIEGDCSMTVKGAKTDGEVETFATLTTTAYFRVLPSAWDANAEESKDLTPSQAVLIQNQIDALLPKIDKAVEASTAADEAIAARDSAVSAAQSAESSAAEAEKAAQDAAEETAAAISKEMSGYVTSAQTAERNALAAQSAAESAQEAAEKARDETQSIVGGDYATVDELAKGLKGKADLVDGKVPTDQIPDMEAGTADEIPITDGTAALLGLPEGDTVDDALALIADKISNGAGAKIATGSYVGTGKYGSANPCTITLDFAPKFVMVYEADMGHLTGFEYYLDSNAPDELFYHHSNTLIAAYGASEASRYSRNWDTSTDHFTWGENSFSWYTTGLNMDAEQQLNKSGRTHYYIAIG